MSNIKHYTMEMQALDWSCTVAIDLDFIQKKEGVETTIYCILRDSYHSLNPDRDWYKVYKPDLIKPWLQVFAEACIELCASDKYSLEEVIRIFDSYIGCPPLDGSMGIRLVEVDVVDFSSHVWDIDEVQANPKS